MATGIELISTERTQHVTKHGWTPEGDKRYTQNELIKAALFCISPTFFEWPHDWHPDIRNRIIGKSRVDQLTVAGAMIAAEIDRILLAIKETENTIGNL